MLSRSILRSFIRGRAFFISPKRAPRKLRKFIAPQIRSTLARTYLLSEKDELQLFYRPDLRVKSPHSTDFWNRANWFINILFIPEHLEEEFILIKCRTVKIISSQISPRLNEPY